MDKAKLKQTMYEQFEPFEIAIQKKISYLQSDNVFSVDMYVDNDNADSMADDSLIEAFNSTVSAQSAPMYQVPVQETMTQIEKTVQPQYVAETPTADSIKAHKQNIAAKIAALRGISMPGDYLKRRN